MWFGYLQFFHDHGFSGAGPINTYKIKSSCPDCFQVTGAELFWGLKR